MPDIDLRIHHDMLVLSAPLDKELRHQNPGSKESLEYYMLMEPEIIHDCIKVQAIAGAQCLVTPTAGITRSRLAHLRLEEQAQLLVDNACEAISSLTPQHMLVEIGPCGLPLDGSSKASLNENRAQYAQAARLFKDKKFDAFFLNGFVNITDAKCALMGLSQIAGAPIFISFDIDDEGNLLSDHTPLEQACAIAAEFGAAVVGFETGADIDSCTQIARRVCADSNLAVLVQLRVGKHDPKQFGPTVKNPYYVPDTMTEAALKLRSEGVQFLRAIGDVTPAYTGILAATLTGADSICAKRSIHE